MKTRVKKTRQKNGKTSKVGKKPVRWANLVGGAIFAGLILWLWFHRERPSPPATPDPASDHRTYGARPTRWMNGERLAERPSVDAQERWDAQLIEMRRTTNWTAPMRPSIGDLGLLDHLRAAQRIVAARTELPGAWRWTEVRRAVLAIGDGIPLVRASVARAFIRMSFDTNVYGFVCDPESLRGFPVEDLAETLVHEATHKVFSDFVLAESRLTRSDFMTVFQRCEDFGFGFIVANEGLAFANEALWYFDVRHASRGADHTDQILGMLRDAYDSVHAREDGFRRYAQNLTSYARFAYRAGLMPQMQRIRCGLPIIADGPHRGEYFFPTDAHPSLLVPIYEWLP